MTDDNTRALEAMPERYGPENNIIFVAWVRKYYDQIRTALEAMRGEPVKLTEEILNVVSALGLVRTFFADYEDNAETAQNLEIALSVEQKKLIKIARQVAAIAHPRPQGSEDADIGTLQHDLDTLHRFVVNSSAGYGLGIQALDRVTAALSAPHAARPDVNGAFKLGDRVQKIKGSAWHGRVVGFYSTELTPIGYAVESEREPGSVQIYPEAAITRAEAGSKLNTAQFLQPNKSIRSRSCQDSLEGWQDISTAPDDGTEVDLWTKRGRRRPNCLYQKGVGWLDRNAYSVDDATHWMPLPAPPTAAIKAALKGEG